jgi:EAL domain-containing protein (putative c-di-GMP-specific phosphodiesterase class I)
VTASFGLCLWYVELPDADAIMRAADSATYRAKALGRSRVVTYDTGMAQYDNLRRRIGIELRSALDNDEIRLVYQPIVSMPDRSCVGFEALARWEHPELGFLSPAIFIPVAEQVGLMSAIGARILRQACDQLAQWQRRDGADRLKLNVNVSPQQMADPAFPAIVADCLSRSGADPKSIALELTETAMLDERGATSETLARLRQMGISIVLDDFGTGFSSLSHLQLLPMDALKIDQSFIKGPNEALASPAIVHALITMSRTLGIGIVAEGVETEKQAALLNHMGCRAAQGFLFSKPLDPEAAFEFLIRGDESDALGQTS